VRFSRYSGTSVTMSGVDLARDGEFLGGGCHLEARSTEHRRRSSSRSAIPDAAAVLAQVAGDPWAHASSHTSQPTTPGPGRRRRVLGASLATCSMLTCSRLPPNDKHAQTVAGASAILWAPWMRPSSGPAMIRALGSVPLGTSTRCVDITALRVFEERRAASSTGTGAKPL
jgi:hypothetical protein